MEKDRMYGPAVRACFIGYVVQAISVDLTPLFFVIFSKQYGMSYSMIAAVIFCGFAAQMCADIFAGHFFDRLGCRAAGIISHAFVLCGLILLGVLPLILPQSCICCGIMAAVIVAQIGGGMIEVFVNPLIDAIPQNGRSVRAKLSFLHSFSCVGHVSVVILTEAVLFLTHEAMWMLIPILWAVVPALNLVLFCTVPLPDSGFSDGEPEAHVTNRKPSRGYFVLLLIIIAAGGAAEQGMTQWISAYAETGLGISKLAGDMLGPCLYALFMGISRTLYGIFSDRIPLGSAMLCSGFACTVCYIAAALSPIPAVSLAACSLTGFAAGLMWPGSFALAAELYPHGGAAVSGRLALFGDIGCTLGPWLIGAVSAQLDMGGGFLTAALFPALFTISVFIMNRIRGGNVK